MKNTTNKLQTYTFSSFTESMTIKAFKLKQHFEPEGYLMSWLNRAKDISIEVHEEKRLIYLNQKLQLLIRGWNEQELREKFISQVIELVDFDIYKHEVFAFAEREMKITYNQSIIQGKVEWMVAKGLYTPEQPFFFIHEYKKEQEAANDPVGQLLVTLCVAQLLNKQKPQPTLFNPEPVSFEEIPLYGTYIIGRSWFFVRLKDQKYYISKAYDSTKIEDLRFVLKMLKAQKQMIIELVK